MGLRSEYVLDKGGDKYYQKYNIDEVFQTPYAAKDKRGKTTPSKYDKEKTFNLMAMVPRKQPEDNNKNNSVALAPPEYKKFIVKGY